MKTLIELTQKTCSRLSAYSERSALSWDEAITKMLNICEAESYVPASPVVAPLSETVAVTIKFYPDENAVIERLLQKKDVYVRITYKDGTSIPKTWRSREFTDPKKFRTNINSHHLRDWRKKGIVKVEYSTVAFE